MTDIPEMFTVVGAIISFAALIVSVYSLLRTKRLRKQFDRKARLGDLADDLNNLSSEIDSYIRFIQEPESDVDFSIILDQIGYTSLEFKHKHDNEDALPTYRLRLGYYDREGSGERYQFPDDADVMLEKLKSGYRATADFEILADDIHLANSRDIAVPLTILGRLYDKIQEVEEEHPELLEEFDPELLPKIESKIDMVVENQYQEGNNIDFHTYPEEHDDVTAIGVWAVEAIYKYDGFEEDVRELSDLNNDLEELRQLALQTSYS